MGTPEIASEPQAYETKPGSGFHTKLAIIGGGPAGYTAAIYAARACLSPIVILGLQPGGQLTTTTEVENYPGFAQPIQGPWLMEQMQAQAEHCGARLLHDLVVSVDFRHSPYRLTLDSGDVWTATSVIIATGAQARWLGLPSEERYKGAGVSACATCDGFFFRGRRVAVIGGGNTAMEEALFLTNHASHVTLIHRRDSLRGEKILQERVAKHPRISVLWNHVVSEVLGEGGHDLAHPRQVTGLALTDVRTGAVQSMPVEGVFVAIGHDPATGIFQGQVPMDAGGYILTQPDSTKTQVPGIFAAGDVRDRIFRQAVTSAGTGCMAALEAERWLSERAGDTPR